MTEKTGIKSGYRTAQNDGTPSANKQKLSKSSIIKQFQKAYFQQNTPFCVDV